MQAAARRPNEVRLTMIRKGFEMASYCVQMLFTSEVLCSRILLRGSRSDGVAQNGYYLICVVNFR